MTDRLFTILIWSVAIILAILSLWILGELIWQGYPHLSWSFLTTEPSNAGRDGGIASIIAATLLILAITLLTTISIGIGTAVWLTEYSQHTSRVAHTIRLSLDILAGVPSIVFGLFGYAFFSIYLGLGFSILSGGLTLTCMILPIFTRTCESGLSQVNTDWRQGAAALGITRFSALSHILLPAIAPAITAALLLGIGRATAETAALIFTSGYVDRMPESIMDSGRTLAVHIYDLSMNVTGGDKAAYATALVLIVMMIIINTAAILISDRWKNKRIITNP